MRRRKQGALAGRVQVQCDCVQHATPKPADEDLEESVPSGLNRCLEERDVFAEEEAI